MKIAIKEIAKIDIKDISDLFNKKEDPEEEFNAALSSLIPDNERLVIFIDELDRCRPTYAVKLHERVQHFFDNEKITFVFSVNLLELRNTIKKFYGANFDGDRYLDRFFDVIIPIPDPD
ncbi:P-loop NTPase fold protein [uncultured Lactobacillus sp.]|uniref:P-loop NTPase fold protein n=1 Tax=uncultured Lactobacillus sp. TaxID=153152 RepID=UPI00344AF2BB